MPNTSGKTRWMISGASSATATKRATPSSYARRKHGPAGYHPAAAAKEKSLAAGKIRGHETISPLRSIQNAASRDRKRCRRRGGSAPARMIGETLPMQQLRRDINQIRRTGLFRHYLWRNGCGQRTGRSHSSRVEPATRVSALWPSTAASFSNDLLVEELFAG
jgi:hypothetical protein